MQLNSWLSTRQIKSLYKMLPPINTSGHFTLKRVADMAHMKSLIGFKKTLPYAPNTKRVWQCLFTWNYILSLAEFHGIQNGTRYSGFLIKRYRKAILSKVTCDALHHVTVMIILKSKQRQVSLIFMLSFIFTTTQSSTSSYFWNTQQSSLCIKNSKYI